MKRFPLPALEEVEHVAVSLARRMMRTPDDEDDLKQEAMVAFWQARLRYPSWRGERPWAMTRTVMARAMTRYYARSRRPVTVSIDSTGKADRPFAVVTEDGVGHTDVFFSRSSVDQEDLLMNEYFDALERAHGATARRVAENLVEIRDQECVRSIMQEVRDKKRRRRIARSGDRMPRGCENRVRVSQRMVRSGLGMDPHEWRSTIHQIRSFTRGWQATQ